MREGTENRLLRAVVFHRPHFVWSSPTKKEGKEGHISSLSLDQLLKTKIAIRAIPTPRRYRNEESYVSEYAPRTVNAPDPWDERKKKGTKVIPPKVVAHATTYEIPRTEITKSERRTCNKCPHPGQKCSFEQYTIAKITPPIPPRRSSSLPKEARIVEVIIDPSAPLSSFALTEKDGHIFQYLVTGPLANHDYFSKPGLWHHVLQRCYTDPCIRHVLFGIAMIHQLRTTAHKSRARELHENALRHYARATRLLRELLTTANHVFSEEDWETTLCATLLFTTFEVMRKNDESAKWWMERGRMLLNRASNSRKPGPCLLNDATDFELGFRDLDLNLRAKKMRARKRDDRKMGKCGAGVLRRRERKAARLSLMAYANH